MEYIKKEFKKIFPMILLIFSLTYFSIPLAISLIGLYLLWEQMYSYGKWDIYDYLGHETFGILLLSLGLFISEKWIGLFLAIITYFSFGSYEWKEKLSPIKYAKKKIKFVLNKNVS